MCCRLASEIIEEDAPFSRKRKGREDSTRAGRWMYLEPAAVVQNERVGGKKQRNVGVLEGSSREFIGSSSGRPRESICLG